MGDEILVYERVGHAGISVGELAPLLNMTVPRTARALRSLRKKGLVRYAGGRWRR